MHTNQQYISLLNVVRPAFFSVVVVVVVSYICGNDTLPTISFLCFFGFCVLACLSTHPIPPSPCVS